MSLEKNFVTPDVKRTGWARFDMKRLSRSIDQIGAHVHFTTSPSRRRLHGAYLPPRDQ